MIAIATAIFLSGCAQLDLEDPTATIEPASINGTTPVWDLLISLGIEAPDHRMTDHRSPEWVKAGQELVFKGSSNNPISGVAGSKISGIYRCIDCHGTSPEQPSRLRIGDPDAKLAYAIEHDLPLVPGATFAGLVNHISWYNGDYAEKYRFSPAVRAAQGSLKKSIEFCSRECSKGRDLESWELDAILAYLWSLEWRLADLGFSDDDLVALSRRMQDPGKHGEIAKEIQAMYSQTNLASFGELPKDPTAGYPMDSAADARNGREIWSRGCLHCHGAGGPAHLFDGNDPMTWKSLDARFDVAVYDSIRNGTQHGKEKRIYMPSYTREKMSDPQIEDLKAYIRSRSQSGSLPVETTKVGTSESPQPSD